jgi:D-alanyl-D-alanine carboxypeptidase
MKKFSKMKVFILGSIVVGVIALLAIWYANNFGVNQNNGDIKMQTAKIEKLFQKTTSSKSIHEATLLIENTAGDVSICQEYNRTIDTPMLMASTTKLFTTTCILALLQEGKLTLDDKITEYLGDEHVEELHVYKGQEYSLDLTIRHLLFQTSGLPDFFLDGAGSAFSKVKEQDFSYSFEDELQWVKSMKPHFAPGTKGKAYYTDVNFDLLGKIIEAVTDQTLQQACDKYIFAPLNLQSTYLVTSPVDFVPHTYYKNRKLERPLFIRSTFASGGGVTTARELMVFLKAFYGGKLFDKEIFSQLGESSSLQMSFFPIHYAGGYMKVKASYPFGKKATLIGHCGSTGSFAFYCPEKDLFFVGDVPQSASAGGGVRLAMKAVLALNLND